MTAGRLVPEPLEIACGTALGVMDAGPLPPPASPTLRTAVEGALLDALARPTCGVSFSGGRDSSVVLALATHVARANGLPLPVPVSLSFDDDAGSEERDYQEAVVAHLGLPDWHRIELTDELDVLGPLSRAFVRRHGLAVPFNVYFHEPILQALRGGSLLTGIGGDELFRAGIHHRANLVVQRLERPRPTDVVRILAAVSPRPVRRRLVAARLRHELEPLPWLRHRAARHVRDIWISDLGRESLSLASSVRDLLWADRGRLLGLDALDALGADYGVRCHSPFSDPQVLSCAAATQGWRDFPSRRAATADLTGDLLPPQVARRPTKATFSRTFFNRHAEAFVAGWDGTLPPELTDLVDAGTLHAMWLGEAERSDARSFSLLQAAYLAQASASGSAQ